MTEVKRPNGKTIPVRGTDFFMANRPQHVKISANQIGFINYGYWIELSRITTQNQLIGWIHHLVGKAWMTTELIEEFIEKVCTIRKWGIYG